MSEAIVFEFKSFQAVIIKAIKCEGFVFSRMNNAEALNEYKVKFWMDGKQQSEWFYEFELEAR